MIIKSEAMEDNEILTGIIRSRRDISPAHYVFQIDNFSLLFESRGDSCNSGVFETAGHKWRVKLYPNGNKQRNVQGFISLYLELLETDSLPLGWQLLVNLKLFVFDHIRDNYLGIQDAGGVRRYHKLVTECGFDHFLSMDEFTNPSNGYLINDCCVFGAEVFVIKLSCQGERLTMIKEPEHGLYTWNIQYSSLDQNIHYSDVFTIGGHKWKLQLYPKGHSDWSTTSMSLFLLLDDSETLPKGRSVYAKFMLRINDQTNHKHYERSEERWFSAPGGGRGWRDFITLDDLHNKCTGYVVNDCLVIQGKIDIISAVVDFS